MLGDLLPAAVAVAATATAATPSIELSNGCGASDAWQELHSASCQSAQLSGTLGRTVEKLLLHAGCGDGPQAAALAPLRQQVKRQLAEKASLEQRLEAAARALRGQRAALAVAPAGGAGPGGPGSNGAAVDEARALRATNQKLEMKLDLYKQQLAARGRSPSEAAASPPPAPPAPAAAAAAAPELRLLSTRRMNSRACWRLRLSISRCFRFTSLNNRLALLKKRRAALGGACQLNWGRTVITVQSCGSLPTA